MAQEVNVTQIELLGMLVTYDDEWHKLYILPEGAKDGPIRLSISIKELKRLSEFLMEAVNKSDELNEHPMGQS